MMNPTDRPRRAGMALLFVLAAALVVPAARPTMAAESQAKEAVSGGEFVCPMHCEGDEKTYHEAGRCPKCGMALVKKDDIIDAAILVFDGVQIIDFTGPYEVFGQAKFNVFTVSETGETITTAMGMSVNPTHSFATSPVPDIILVPGGGVHEAYDDPKVIEWLVRRSETADHVLSVCNGAFIVARAGLLDGKSATTFYGLIEELKEFRPQVTVVSDQRFVDNGKVITSAGLSSGIDAALHLVAKIRGRGEAERLALHLEYQWDPDSEFARAALADLRIPRLRPPDGAEVSVEATGGDRESWEIRYRVTGGGTMAELQELVETSFDKADGWKRAASHAASGKPESRWTFLDEEKRPWESQALFEPVEDHPDEILVTLRVHLRGREIAERS